MAELEVPLIRVYRAARGESFEEARRRRPEVVTLDTVDLLCVVTRCKTPISSSEVAALRRAAATIPKGAGADIVLANDKALVDVRDRSVELALR